MKITKFGHSCLLVEEKNARILIDPGSWSIIPDRLDNLDAILVTHEHADHLSLDYVKLIIKKNPQIEIYANEGVGKKLAAESIPCHTLGHGDQIYIKGVLVEGTGEKHAFMFHNHQVVRNTGYMIGERFFYPGDAFTVPPKAVEILAYPAIAPWMKLFDALEYGKAIKPKVAFPVHDGFLKFGGPYYNYPEKEFTAAGTRWVVLEQGEPQEF